MWEREGVLFHSVNSIRNPYSSTEMASLSPFFGDFFVIYQQSGRHAVSANFICVESAYSTCAPCSRSHSDKLCCIRGTCFCLCDHYFLICWRLLVGFDVGDDGSDETVAAAAAAAAVAFAVDEDWRSVLRSRV